MTVHYRSVWISDVHLCCRDCQAEVLYSFLDQLRCDHLYLVGDIVDVWALRKRWLWPAQYNEVLHKILKRARKGAKVVYIPGNHDEALRGFAGMQFGAVEIQLEAVHTTADGRRLLVVHGDEFDAVVRYHKWLCHLGSWAYGHLTRVNSALNAIRRRLGKPYWSLSGSIKRRVKSAIRYVADFETTLTDTARRRGVDGVVCGHIHQPVIRELDGILYCNTGDWVENCTAIVEHYDGRLELIWWHNQVDERCGDMASGVALPYESSNGRSSARRRPVATPVPVGSH